jgi:hypothetical protein
LRNTKSFFLSAHIKWRSWSLNIRVVGFIITWSRVQISIFFTWSLANCESFRIFSSDNLGMIIMTRSRKLILTWWTESFLLCSHIEWWGRCFNIWMIRFVMTGPWIHVPISLQRSLSYREFFRALSSNDLRVVIMSRSRMLIFWWRTKSFLRSSHVKWWGWSFNVWMIWFIMSWSRILITIFFMRPFTNCECFWIFSSDYLGVIIMARPWKLFSMWWTESFLLSSHIKRWCCSLYIWMIGFVIAWARVLISISYIWSFTNCECFWVFPPNYYWIVIVTWSWKLILTWRTKSFLLSSHVKWRSWCFYSWMIWFVMTGTWILITISF